MRPTGIRARRKAASWMLALLSVAAVVGISAAGASGKQKHPTSPTCADFSLHKVSHVLGIGTRMYLSHTLVHGTSCTYAGVTNSRAKQLATDNVAWNKIKYYPSLLIDVQTTKKSLFDVQLNLLKMSFTTVDKTSRKDRWRIGSQEYFTSADVTGAKLPACNSGILYNNWLGPPECKGQPALFKVAVLAWIPLAHGKGRMVFLSAAAQSGSPLHISHMLELAKESVTGQLY
jgi:hypothetical protein